MITLKFNTSIAGNNYAHQRGDAVDWYDDRDAHSLIHAGIAKPVTEVGKKAYEEYRAKKLAAEAAKKAVKIERRDKKPLGETPAVNPETPANTETPVPISELDLDDATLKVLSEAGLVNVADVANHPDLTKINGVAKATKDKILKAVAAVKTN